MNRTLFNWLMQPLWAFNAILSIVAAVFALCAPGPLFEHRVVPILFAAVHIAFVVALLSPARPGVAGFLYTRGLSRDLIWNHITLVTAASILIVWTPAALIAMTPIRSALHDLLQSPFYPLIYAREWSTPFRWLLAYVCFASVAHYIWTRGLQPCQDRGPGLPLGAGVVIVALILAYVPPIAVEPAPALKALVVLGAIAIAAICFRAGRQLHRTLELNA